MLQGLEEIGTATRVLMAIAGNREPLASDVARLHELVPDGRDLSLDELACEAIQQALRQRAKARSRVALK